jgi:DNA polymerase-3 subunit beta
MKEIQHPQLQVISRLIEGEYPNYQEIIPTKFKTHITLKRDELLSQIKTASLFSGKINEVRLTVNPDRKEVEVFAQSPDLGKSQSIISAKVDGETMDVSFNHKFLIDGLVNIKSSEVVLDMSEKEGPCVLKPVGDASYLYVVMPIKST